MEGIPTREALIEAIRKAKEEGKTLPAIAERLLAEADAAAPGKLVGKGKMAAALYLLGASLRQLSDKLGITRGTAYSYVRSNLPEGLRKLASEQRDYGRSGPLIGSEMIDKYIVFFAKKKDTMRGWSAPQIAAAMKREETAPIPVVESLEDSDGEPY